MKNGVCQIEMCNMVCLTKQMVLKEPLHDDHYKQIYLRGWLCLWPCWMVMSDVFPVTATLILQEEADIGY